MDAEDLLGSMKLSLKVEYACQVLAQLGHTFGKAELPHIDELAQAESIPANYLVQILNELRNSGLIVSRRGKMGGYALAREPRAISMLDIVRAVDGDVLELSGEGTGASGARTHAIWRGIAKGLSENLRRHTVDDLMQAAAHEMYYI